jgi:hypothetical protein
MAEDEKPGDERNNMQAEQSSHKRDARIGKEVQSKIGQQLRALYDDVVSQGVPDRFADLLNRLDAGMADKGTRE